MTSIQSIFRYVFIACVLMVLYCVYNANRVDVLVSSDTMKECLFFQLLFTTGAIVSYLIYKHED